MKEYMEIAKALGDPNRARILMFLREGELCVCQIVELLQLAPSTVSKHLTVLHQAGLIGSRKEGRWIYYRPAGRGAPGMAREAARWVRRSLENDPLAARDAARLKSVLKTDIRKLCERYHTGAQ